MKRRNFLKTVGAGAAALALPKNLPASSGPLGEAEIERLARDLVGKMTLNEKIGQMSGRITDGFYKHSLGYGRYTTFNTRKIERLNLPGIRFIDGPRGINFEGSTCFPCAMARGATWDPALNQRVGSAVGYEARSGGANYFGGVCINVLHHPGGGRAQETFGEDPHHLGVMGASMTQGVQEHVMACAKHYCCNNNEDARFWQNVQVDERTLREIYLPHFKACVDAGVASIMSAYNDVNGHLCGQNRRLLTEILKDDWGFTGFVVSDFSRGVEATVPAAMAGLDIEMPWTLFYGTKLKMAVKSGRAPEAVIDQAVLRIVRQQLRFLHLEDAPYDDSKRGGPEHAALAREVAAKSIVLLKNEGRILPLDKSRVRKLAVVGRLADFANIGDRGSSTVRPPYTVTPLQGIRELAGAEIEILHSASNDPAAARELARKADAVVIVAGLDYQDEGEGGILKVQRKGGETPGGDRLELGLHPDEEKLIKAVTEAHDRVIVVLEGGSAITMRGWADRAPAILMAWYPGMEGGRAIADALFGRVNPSGRLPFVWPKSREQIPRFQNRAAEPVYDYYHGYRFFDKNHLEPEFPFGHGLSYTDYEYSNLRLDQNRVDRTGAITAQVEVTNIGSLAGEETVQLYVGANGSRVDRPVKDLKGFARISLAPGETKTVSLAVKAPDLAYFDAASMGWVVEDIEYSVMVGPSSRESDLMLKDSFTVSY